MIRTCRLLRNRQPTRSTGIWCLLTLVVLRRGGLIAPFPEDPVQTVRADFPHTAYRWFSRATCTTSRSPMVSGCRLAATYKAALEFSRFGKGVAFAVAVGGGVVGSFDHALALTSTRRRNQSRAPSLHRLSPASTVLWTPRTPARRGPLSPSAYRDRLRWTSAAGTGLSCSASSCVRMPSSLPRGRPAPLR